MNVEPGLEARIRFADAVQAATDAEFAGVKATARKSGRNAAYPFVPVLAYPAPPAGGLPHVEQVRALAFETRPAAVGAAERVLFEMRVSFTRKLADPTKRALRESRGLPREVPS